MRICRTTHHDVPVHNRKRRLERGIFQRGTGKSLRPGVHAEGTGDRASHLDRHFGDHAQLDLAKVFSV